MNRQGDARGPQPAGRWRFLVGHLAAGLLACALTVSILGSLSYLGISTYRDREERRRVAAFVSGLELRDRDELDYIVSELRRRPALAARVLPTVLRAAQRDGIERRQLAAIDVTAALLDVPGFDDRRIEQILFSLRTSGNPAVAARAVAALARLQPARRACERLTDCLDTDAPAVEDEVCVGLLALGESGARALRGALDKLDIDRKIWLTGLLAERRPDGGWVVLEALLTDRDAPVRIAAADAAGTIGGPDAPALLARRLDDAAAPVRHAAARNLGRLVGERFVDDDGGVELARQWVARRGARANAG